MAGGVVTSLTARFSKRAIDNGIIYIRIYFRMSFLFCTSMLKRVCDHSFIIALFIIFHFICNVSFFFHDDLIRDIFISVCRKVYLFCSII